MRSRGTYPSFLLTSSFVFASCLLSVPRCRFRRWLSRYDYCTTRRLANTVNARRAVCVGRAVCLVLSRQLCRPSCLPRWKTQQSNGGVCVWDEGKVSPFFLFLFLSNIYFLQISFFFFLSTKGKYHAAGAAGAAALVPMGPTNCGGGPERGCGGDRGSGSAGQRRRAR